MAIVYMLTSQSAAAAAHASVVVYAWHCSINYMSLAHSVTACAVAAPWLVACAAAAVVLPLLLALLLPLLLALLLLLAPPLLLTFVVTATAAAVA
jgi:hypothetical protein